MPPGPLPILQVLLYEQTTLNSVNEAEEILMDWPMSIIFYPRQGVVIW